MQLFCGRNRGAISVFLTLILVPVLVFCGIIVDASRLFASKTIVSGAGELTMNAALSEYDKTLKDGYGLMAMAKKPDAPASLMKLEQYFEESCNVSLLENADTEDLHTMIKLELAENGFSAKGVEGSSLAEYEVLRQQMLEYMKFRGPVYMVTDIIEKFKNLPLDNIDKKQDYVKKKADYGKKLSKLGAELKKAKEFSDEQNQYLEALQYGGQGIASAIDEYKYNSVFWLAARSLEKYLSLESLCYIGDGGDISPERVKQYLALDIEWNQGKTEFDEVFYSDMLAALSLYQSQDSLSPGMTEEFGFTEEEIEKFYTISKKINRSILVLDKIHENYVQEFKEKLDTYEREADQIVKSGEKAIDNLKKVRKQWLEKVSKAKNAYKDAGEELRQAGEDMSFEDSEEDELEINVEELDEFSGIIQSQIDAAKAAKDRIAKLKNIPASLKKTSPISGAEGESIANMVYGASQAISSYWDNHMNDYEEFSFVCIDLQQQPFYENCLAKISEEEKDPEKKSQQESMQDEAKVQQDVYNQLLDEIRNSDNEKNLKNDAPGGMNYPDDFPSRLAKSKDTGNMMQDINVKDDEENVTGSVGNMELVTQILNGMDKLAGELLERAYLMEYITEMFNCLTTTTEADFKKDDSIKKSLSGEELTSHFIYNGEMEYILYGNQSTAANKAFALSQTFGIRLAVNCIYVFMDKGYNLTASAVAAGLSVGMPWLYPIIKYGYLFCCGLGLSGKDIAELAAGRDVNVWPSNDKFKLSYKEYLKLYILIGLIEEGNEKNIVLRTADCIQLNTGKMLKDKYTMLTLNAEVKASTTFLPKVPAFLGQENKNDDGKRRIRYQSILAY
ncbi:DUF5702 domain-containing protein [Blautia schinkii]|nr:DUF5702 domain-containing protein [Blautia schinkii]